MRYVCAVCSYVYDEEAEGVPFDALPDTWKCPTCGADKSFFKPEVTEERVAAPVEAVASDEGHAELSVGQLSALCSNLARGCEKQYKPEEAKLFSELADYFAAITPPVEDASVEAVASLLQGDIDGYPDLRATADANADRGAARVCVWGNKVTMMLLSLVNRYLTSGEPMLAGTNVWVCTVCGFVFIGDEAPELCPVCKVPSWKFERV